MTLDELKSTRLFKLLQPNEAKWVEVYVETGGDVNKATITAFNTTTDKLTRMISRRVLTEPRVNAVLAVWNGELEDEPSLDDFRREVWRQARECKSDQAREKLLRLYAEARGWIKPGRGGVETPKPNTVGILDEIENPDKPKES
jgi:hypothetical protein